MKFENFQEAYLHNMKNVYLTPEFINEPRGNKSKEVLNLSFVIENPIERVSFYLFKNIEFLRIEIFKELYVLAMEGETF